MQRNVADEFINLKKKINEKGRPPVLAADVFPRRNLKN